MKEVNNIVLSSLIGMSSCLAPVQSVYAMDKEVDVASVEIIEVELPKETVVVAQAIEEEPVQEEVVVSQEEPTVTYYVEPVVEYTYVEYTEPVVEYEYIETVQPVVSYETVYSYEEVVEMVETVSYVEDEETGEMIEIVEEIPVVHEELVEQEVEVVHEETVVEEIPVVDDASLENTEPKSQPFESIDPTIPSVYIFDVPEFAQETDEYEAEVDEDIQKLIDNILNSEQIETEEILPMIGEDHKKIFTETNNEDLYSAEVISENGDQKDYIFIVDENAAVYVIKDTDGNGIANATVSISYVEDGNRVQRTIVTTDGNVKGIAAFDDLKGTRYGLVDITMDGYHSVTFFDDEITGGITRNVILEKNKESEVYVRAVDMDGRDLVNNDTTLSLIENDENEYRLSILLSQVGSAVLPSEIQIVSKTDGRVVCTLGNPVAYEGTTNTYLFTTSDNWISQAGPLKEKDELVLVFGNTEFALKNVLVKNAINTPTFVTDKQMSVDGIGQMPKFPEQSPFLTPLTFGFAPWNLKVSCGILPNGNYYIICSKKIETFSKDLRTIFEKSNSPKGAEKASTLMDRFLDSFTEDLVKAASKYTDAKGDTIPFFDDPLAGAINSSVTAMLSGSYNEEKGRYEGDFSAAFSVDTFVGKHAYAILLGMPITFGIEFDWKLDFKFGQSMNADTIIPLHNFEFDSTRTKPFQFHSSPTLKLFIGIGVRNIIGADLTGTAAFDVGFIWHDEQEPGNEHKDPHVFIDFSSHLSANLYLVLMTKTLEIMDIYDTRILESWDKNSLEAYILKEGELIPLDLSIGKENILEYLSSFEDGKLETYSIDVPAVNAPSGLELISSDSFIENQIQLISTKDTTALFRLISKDGMTKLVYQLQNPETGEFENVLHEVPMPDGRSVYEFVATDQKIEQFNIPAGYVYIGAVTGDIDSDDAHQRAHSTSVVGLIVDIDEGKLIRSKVVTTPSDDAFYFAPVPVHNHNDVIIAYKEAKSYDTSNQFKNYLVTSDGTKVLMSENVPVYTTNVAESLWKTTIWTVDTTNTDQNTLQLIGYNIDGTQKAYKEGDTDYDHIWNNFRVSFDVSEFKEKFPDSDPIACIGYLRGTTYMIVGGKLYQFVQSDGTKPIEVIEMESYPFSDVTLNGGNGHYQMLTNHELGTLFITSLKSVVKADEGTTDAKLLGNELELNYIVEETDYLGTHVTLHGPRTYFIEGAQAYKYTCSYNSHDMGIELVIDAYHDKNRNSNDIYAWEEKAGYGLELKDLYIENSVVTNTQEYIKGFITYHNTGYGTAKTITIQVKDSTGKILNQAEYNPATGTYTDLGEIVGYSKVSLYPADSYTFPIYFKTNPDWETNTDVEIIVSMLNEKKEEVSQLKLLSNTPSLVFSGKQEVLNGNHYASFKITNHSVTPGERASVVLTTVWANDEKNTPIQPENVFDSSNILRTFTTGKGSFLSSHNASSIVYNVTYNIEDMWEKLIGEGVLGVKAYFVSSDGKLLSETPIYFSNPYYGKKKNNEDKPVPVTPVTPVIYPVVEYTQTASTVKKEGKKKDKEVSYPRLFIDGKEVRVDTKLTVQNGIKGYRLFMMDKDGNEILIGILSEDGFTVILFKDYIKVLEEKNNHEAIIEYEDGKKDELSVEILQEKEEVVKEDSAVEKETNKTPFILVGIGALIALIYALYKKIKK